MTDKRKRMNGRITAYIDLDAVAQNFKSMKEHIKDNVRMVAVVKTDGYGHGAVPIARMVEKYDYIWGFAVAASCEARELREAGIKKPVMILGYAFEEDYEWMAAHGVRPSVFSYETARQFADAAKRCGVQAPIHIAVDTGMSRIGVTDDKNGIDTVKQISLLTDIQIEGVFTHFAKADETDKSFTTEQIARFSAFCDGLEAEGVRGFIRHCSNSAGIMEIPSANMDMVRAGISIYGVYPSEEVDRSCMKLLPAMSLKSHIIHLNKIQPGTSVSYGGIFTAEKETVVATVPAGYGDGYPRSLSDRGYVLVRGRRAPILGRICMDQFMIDVTDIDAELFDEVTLLGRDGTQEITLEEIDKYSGRFPYEFICDIGKRVPRIYLGGE